MSSDPPDRIGEARAQWQQPQEMAQPQYGVVPAQPPQWVQAQSQGMPAVVAPRNPAISVLLSVCTDQAPGFRSAASHFRSVSSLIRACRSREKSASVLFRTSV